MNDKQFALHLEALGLIREKLEEVRCGLIDVENALKPAEINVAMEEAEESGKKELVSMEKLLKNIEYNTNLLRR